MSTPVTRSLSPSSGFVRLLHFQFFMTGIVTALLGPLLLFFIKRCALTDAEAGFLIAVQFSGNFLGSFFATRNLRRSVLLGMTLIGVGVSSLAFVSCRWVPVCIGCYGVGLGLTISAINLIVADRQPFRRAYSLSVLNFVWCAGAVGSPVLVGWAQRNDLVSFALLAIGACALGLALGAGGLPDILRASAGTDHSYSGSYSSPLLFFASVLFLYVGLETAVGNWTAPYGARLQGSGEIIGVSAVTCFWLALLIGRIICALLLRHLSEMRMYLVALLASGVGIVLLLAARSGKQLIVAVSITGLGLAPLFPLLLSFASGALLASRNTGWVFSVAALGGAVIPWLTGRLSTSVSSLRTGLAVPASTLVLIVVLSVMRAKQLRGELELRNQRPYLKDYNTGVGGPTNSPKPEGKIIIKQ